MIKRLKRIFKWVLGIIGVTLMLFSTFFFFYANTLKGVNPKTISYYYQLKTELKAKGYKDQLIIISSQRAAWHNQLLTLFGAATKSRHLRGDAIDIMVLDVNADGIIDGKDVDIVYILLDREIVKNTGGLGTYQSERWIWNRQMIHVDCRQKKARWHR
ncbi:DUF882 domain-containing protein [Fulvivirgaceae bacterium BMA12]|uniref:DUF882 domain-containing protein n=1 Tax=Agaribacillus aureus TaxID=3051825 RepID=A0ABT8LAF5_9BACT|nr:DUF882 domain-containing protein [Fulvivirgaceae bacterium BMA12]